jgi:DNA-binding IclR family transcriptional regulator
MSTASGTPRTQSLARAIRLLHAVAERPAGSSASELARATSLPRSTVSRTLRTLADHGLVEAATAGDGWVLGYELVRLARAADPNRRLVEIAVPALSRLRDATSESALLAVPRGAGMEIVLQLDPKRHVGVANWVGADVPLHASSAGKLVLASLDERELEAWLGTKPLGSFTERTIVDAGAVRAELARVRRQGWAELVDELEEGIASISVPVRSTSGALVAVVGVSGPTFRLTRMRRRALLSTIRATAAAIERAAAT